MLTTFADQAMGMTAQRASGGKRHATIELNIQFVGAVRLNEFVEAHCEVVRLTRAIIFMQCKLMVGARAVANATGIWKIRGEG
jgi:acyl-coenzyme A thioesterase PaaI-like protein